ncbi:MAG: FecCD family ABC transporter permease [Candidatus Tectimicrobiota bacterium]
MKTPYLASPALLAWLLLLGALSLSTTYGTVALPLSHIWAILASHCGLPLHPTWQPWEATILLEVRLPRIVVAACVGAGLTLCGVTMQGLFRNPLADPGVLGVSAGAALGAVLAIYLGLAVYTIWAIPLLACLGAGLTAFTVYTIATRQGRTPLSTLLLAGVALGALMGALTSFVLSLSLANYDIGRQVILWLLGGLEGRTWEHVLLVAPVTLLGAAVIVAYARDLDAFLLGEQHATSVGVDVPRVRQRLVAATSLITGAGVAVSGVIGFVGLIIPHMLRGLLGPGHQRLLPLSMLVGAAFLVLADCLARTIIAPEEMRLGVITAVIGAPFFLVLLLRQRHEGRVE